MALCLVDRVSYLITPGGIGSLRLLAPQWVRYGPAVPGGYLKDRTDLAQVGDTYRKELHNRLRLREVSHRLPEDDTMH